MLTRRLSVLALTLAAGLSFGLADLAWACSCVRFASADEQFARSEAVFRGRVEKTERLGRYRAATTFVVVERLKGRLGQRVRVEHGTETGGACGVIFRRGEVRDLTAHRGERGQWATSSCSMPQFSWKELRRAARHAR